MTSQQQARRAVRARNVAALIALVAAALACSAPTPSSAPTPLHSVESPTVQALGTPWAFGLSPSVLPNFGLAATLDRELREWQGGALAGEIEFTQQFLDDVDVTGIDRAAAGDWTQVKVGARWARTYDEGRWWSLRAGFVWFRARGEPNLLDLPGDYYGFYFGPGFETRLSRHWTLGPSLEVLVAPIQHEQDFSLIPQLVWRFLYTP